jgi:superfamily II DNA or RNA helicase
MDTPPEFSRATPTADYFAGKRVPPPRPPAGTSSQENAQPARPALKAGPASRSLVVSARHLNAEIATALAEPDVRRRAARAAYEEARNDIVQQQLDSMPLARLKETTQGRLRLGALERAGYRTVGAVAKTSEFWLQQLDGVGPQTASRVVAAARQVEHAMRQTVRVRFDLDSKPGSQAKLLRELHAFGAAVSAVSQLGSDASAVASDLDGILGDADRGASRLRMFFSGSRRRGQARRALSDLDSLMRSPRFADVQAQLTDARVGMASPGVGNLYLWHDYEQRAVAYNGLLIEVAELGPDEQAGQGFLPADIATRVREHPLDVMHLKVSLRGYQAFGAKFALTQGRSFLGDEMGLGKTIEALAIMCHLRAEGATHFLVVCPASVLVNWGHEIQSHSALRAYRLHGLDRDRNYRAWQIRGGVAVTTYESLRSIPVPYPDGIRLGLLVVDEAHYAKNPAAERTKTVQAWASRTERVLFLSGTPMENKVEEFRSLVGHLRPDIAARVRPLDGLAGAARFRQAVAPVYLRRNQADVLDELPPRIESEEWVTLEGPGLLAYRDAVASGNFMAMRRAAYAPATTGGSAKLARLAEIAEEAASNGRKAVVFSFFHDVLQAVTSILGSATVGPLTGSVSPVKRQGLVDEFTARQGPAVLVSQIQAGGVGLNIQAASVVIIAEPQWKPTIEEQAIARCHRMGQVRTVDVHRLLAEESVDERMLEILAAKAILFDEYVRRSELKETTPDSVDVSDLTATKETVTQAEAERRIIEMERKRLRLESDYSADS